MVFPRQEHKLIACFFSKEILEPGIERGSFTSCVWRNYSYNSPKAYNYYHASLRCRTRTLDIEKFSSVIIYQDLQAWALRTWSRLRHFGINWPNDSCLYLYRLKNAVLLYLNNVLFSVSLFFVFFNIGCLENKMSITTSVIFKK